MGLVSCKGSAISKSAPAQSLVLVTARHEDRLWLALPGPFSWATSSIKGNSAGMKVGLPADLLSIWSAGLACV
jgi:hypothetical protein